MYLKRKMISYLFICSIILSDCLISIQAAGVSPGGSFSATLSCGFYEGTVSVSANNASVTSVSNSSFCDRGKSITATASAGSVGSASISFVSSDIINTNTMTEIAPGTYLGGTSVSVIAPSSGGSGANNNGQTGNTPSTPQEQDNRSSNNNLASLKVSQGTLSPAFHADTLEYSVNLSAKTTSIKVEGSVADAKASITGVGEIALKPGENIITISVKAENGATKNYVIKAMVDEKPLVYTNFNDTKLGVVRNLDGVQPPATFEKTKISLAGKEVDAWTSNVMNKTIVYLVDEKNNEKNFYLYDTKKESIISVFKPVSILGRNVFIVDLTTKQQKLTGMTFKKIMIDKTEMMGWEFNDKQFKNYNLIYVMDENGNMQYYQYEKTQNTLQLYSGAAPISQEKYTSLENELSSANLLKIVFMVFSFILLLTTSLGVYTTLKLRNKIKK